MGIAIATFILGFWRIATVDSRNGKLCSSGLWTTIRRQVECKERWGRLEHMEVMEELQQVGPLEELQQVGPLEVLLLLLLEYHQ
jgi:hypothetical protein